MSNYVTNYIFCNENLYNDFINVDFDHRQFKEGIYDPTGCILNNNRRLLIFDTRGMAYKNVSIEKIISNYHDVVWNCVEENLVEEGKFYWDGEKVVLTIRKLQESDEDCFFSIRYYDPSFKTFKTIIGFPNRIVEENYVTNTRKEFLLSEQASKQVMSYMNSMRIKILNDSGNGEYPVEIKGDIIDEYWFWSSEKSMDYASISRCESGLTSQKEYDKGERAIKNVKKFLESFFCDFDITIKLTYKEISEFAYQ